jgi:hypothetical protein
VDDEWMLYTMGADRATSAADWAVNAVTGANLPITI